MALSCGVYDRSGLRVFRHSDAQTALLVGVIHGQVGGYDGEEAL